jgi:16S rRNA (uracil1498-N3)-methyltransferase
MQIFYAPVVNGETCVLDKSESKHCIRVLRMKRGTEVQFVDGKGNLYTGFISDPDPLKCKIEITSVIHNFEKRNYRLHIAISPLKNHDRFEWFVEKSVEIGIDVITPLICCKTIKPGIKVERVENIIISAMKQSIKAEKTRFKKPAPFEDFINLEHGGVLLIAHCRDTIDRIKINDVYSKGEDAVIMIGPEGDFSDEEIEKASRKGFRQIHLGESRMRTETAGIAACHSVYFINQ